MPCETGSRFAMINSKSQYLISPSLCKGRSLDSEESIGLCEVGKSSRYEAKNYPGQIGFADEPEAHAPLEQKSQSSLSIDFANGENKGSNRIVSGSSNRNTRNS
jgi:hypothetical protein